jgi:chemotaxis methyl-accepting protein methylase
MLKFGIYKKEQLKNKAGFKNLIDKDKKISITLYDQITKEPNADEIAELILLLFSDERGAYKRTYQKRFEEFDKKVLTYLKTIFKENEPLSFHDVGVSDGRTALDFFEKIFLIFPNIQYTASDYNPAVYVIQNKNYKITLSHTVKILEILFPPFVFNVIKRDSIRHYPINHLVRLLVQFFVAVPMVKKYKLKKIQARELMLFAPKVLNTAKTDPRFQLRQHDLLTPLSKPVHIIRAMNVLNPSYFSEDEFFKILKHIHEGLNSKGVLITGSNQEADTTVDGGIYEKNKDGFELVEQSGEGSPINNLILKFKK